MAMIGNQLGLGIILSWKNMMSKNAKKAEADLKKLGKQAKRTGDESERAAEKMAAAMAGYQKQLRSGMKFMIAGAIIMAPFALMTKDAAKAQQGLADVESLLRGTGTSAVIAKNQIAGLKAQILNIAPATRIPMNELISSSYDLVSANLTVNEAMGLLKPTADLAVAGMGSMKEATNTMTSAINTFGKTWGDSMTPFEKGVKIANTYAGTIAGLKTTLPDLTAAMAYAAGDANVLGVSLAETTVAIGLLQTKGVFGAKAGTTIQAMFRGFLQFGQKSAAALGPLAGMQLKDSAGNLRKLADIMQDIEERLEGLGKFAKSEILLRAFGEESSRAAKLLLGQSDAMRENVRQVENSNALMGMVAARQDTLLSGWAMLKNSIKAISIMLGDTFVPIMRIATVAIQTVAHYIGLFISTFPVLSRLMALITALAGLLIFLVGTYKIVMAAMGMFKLVMAATTLVTTMASGGMMVFAAATWAALWPILLVVAAVGALVTGLGYLAGFDVWDALKGIFTVPSIEMPTVSMAGAGNIQLQGMTPQQQMPMTQQAGGVTSAYDYSTNKVQNIFNIDGTKQPRQTANEVQRLQDRDKKRSHAGEM